MALPDILKNNLRLPAIGAPLFIIANPALVIEQCKSGIIGAFPALNARTPEQLNEWLAQITEELQNYNQQHPAQPAAPFAVNQIVHRSNHRLQQDLELCIKYKVPVVISSLGAVPEVNAAIHSYGGIVLHDVINNRHANSAIRKGADGLIAVAAGAGGHAGTLSPFALMAEIREWFDGPVALSGAISSGSAILAAQTMGANLAYIGSPFIATKEANAVNAYKEMIVQSSAKDIVYSNYFTGIHGNYLRPSIEAAGMDPDHLPEADPSKMDFQKATTGAKAWKDIWGCGQGIGAVKEILPAGQLVERWIEQYKVAKSALCAS
ncbi:nitronate monooxygenase family protein [Bacillus subtilis]|uniref:NAD(P)H-dependent flavin oxidoreductase n=1 Tax=Pseudochrobactrum asaccharolyticum TaxID=354351 RepID=UPI001F41633F|nr:nitronate monooxygenase family protein [Pseudochrobactrum asaccharolyticum]MCF7644041.1 nitronate monooxygenase family protein [Pseudochrobactrum asaccharolyticum]MCF7670723.1 nitronate monooxygenase family protein [Bacillus subtilis]